MILSKIQYAELNSKQKEIFNFQKVAGVLADYGFNCIKLADDWQGADFLAYHKDGGDTLKVQLKGRMTISKAYQSKDLYMCFRLREVWYLVEHDDLVEHLRESTNYLSTDSWQLSGVYHSARPNHATMIWLSQFALN